MERQTTRKEERQRKFLLILPVLVVPFVTLMFWALGGGSGNNAMAQSVKKPGINTQLPDARFDGEKPQDKMGYYDHADADSARLKEQWQQDPSFSDMSFPGSDTTILEEGDTVYYNMSSYGKPNTFRQDPNEVRAYRQLEQLNAALKQNNEPPAETYQPYNPPAEIEGVDRLEQMMQQMNRGSEDPEMKQIDGMLNRILDIQHPERVKERLRETSKERKGSVFAVSTTMQKTGISLLQNNGRSSLANGDSGFYSVDNVSPADNRQNVIEAVVHETQTVVNGSTIKMRLLNDIFINGRMIPKDRFIYGTASLNGERLEIQISGIQYDKNLFPVALSVYDLDGLAGIYVPGAIARDVAKQSTDRSLQNIGISSVDGSWQAQAAGAGVEAAKTLFSRKVKLIRVTLKAGYRVLLYDEKQKQDNN